MKISIYYVFQVESEFKCLTPGSEEVFSMSPLIVPSDAVPDSDRAWVYVTGDIMAPALENVGNLVNLPTGCGEQNMVGMVPNIYLMQYLDATNQRDPELQRKAREYMEVTFSMHISDFPTYMICFYCVDWLQQRAQVQTR